MLQESGEARVTPRALTAEVESLKRELERMQALARSDRGVLDAILNHSPHGILVSDATGKLVLQNRASERIWGGSASATSVEAWQAYRAFHPDGRPYAPGDWAMARCLSHGEIIEPHEIDIQRFDDSRGVLLGSCSPIYDQDGRISGAVSVFADITRFKELEAELRSVHAETELLYRLTAAVVQSETSEEIFEHALDAVLEGLHAERASILVFDDANVMRFRAWRGLSPEYRRAVDGHSPWTADVVDPTPIIVADIESDPAMAAYRETFRAEDIRALGFFPLVHRRRLLGKFMVYSRTPRVFSERDGRIAVAIGSHVAHGVARRAADLAVSQALRARDEMLAVVSHDLRNPVNTLTLTVSSLLNAAAKQQDQMLHLKAARMQRSLTGMNRLIGDLLDVSAVDRGALQVQMEDIDLEPVVADAIDLMRPLVDERRQELKIDVPSGGRVRADRQRIVQVLSNIIGNATKFAPVGGWISVQASNVDVGGREFVEVRVTDNGPGIAAEHLSRIFERFWRPRQDGQGVGLGLAIARGVVEAHGGRISVENASDGGAIFRFTLPGPVIFGGEEDG